MSGAIGLQSRETAQFAASGLNSGKQKLSFWHLAAIVFFFAAILVQGVINIRGMSLTWDESMYMGVGNYLLRTAHMDFGHVEALHFHPIWTFYLNSLFLLFMDLPAETLAIPQKGLYTLSAGHELLFHSGYSPETILFLIRLPILLQTLVLALVMYRFASRLFGPNAGLMALAMLAFEPNVLAHSGIACTDSSITVWLFTTAYAYWEYLNSPSKGRLAITGLCAGLAVLSKINAPVLLAVILPGMYCAHRFESIRGKISLGRKLLVDEFSRLKHYLLLAAIVFFMVWGAYWFGFNCDYKSHAQIQAEGIHGLKAVMQSNEFIRLPLAPYLVVVANVTNRGMVDPRHAYMLGQHSTDGFRTYVFFDFLVKTPLPILLLLFAAVVLWRRAPRADLSAETGLILGSLFQILLAVPEHSNCGIRYILPVYPFLLVWISRIAGSNWRRPLTVAQKPLAIAVVALLLWNAVESAIACPNQIAYYNTLFKDPAKRYRYLADSNLDWGNELYALRDFMKSRQIDEINLDYFGNVDPASYGIKYKPADENSKGWVAISATDLVGAYGKHDFSAFRALEPAAVLCDGGMLIYYRK